MRKVLFTIPLVLAAAVLAQDAETPADLVKKLGDDEYAVREEATAKLIEMGEVAVPALEKALNSADLEVRLRAGRALSAIRRGPKRAEERDAEAPPRASATNKSVEIQMADGKVKVRVRRVVDGKEEVKEYEGESLEQLKKDHPELQEALGGFRFRTHRGKNPFDFDMDRFWKEWGQDFDDDFWRDLHKDLEKDMERQKRWIERSKKLYEEALKRAGGGLATPAGPQLGIRSTLPDAVLNAQLNLRGRGIVVDAVEKGTRADRLGLVRYDILLELNGVEIRHPRDVTRTLGKSDEEAKLTAKVLRRGEVLELSTGD